MKERDRLEGCLSVLEDELASLYSISENHLEILLRKIQELRYEMVAYGLPVKSIQAEQEKKELQELEERQREHRRREESYKAKREWKSQFSLERRLKFQRAQDKKRELTKKPTEKEQGKLYKKEWKEEYSRQRSNVNFTFEEEAS